MSLREDRADEFTDKIQILSEKSWSAQAPDETVSVKRPPGLPSAAVFAVYDAMRQRSRRESWPALLDRGDLGFREAVERVDQVIALLFSCSAMSPPGSASLSARMSSTRRTKEDRASRAVFSDMGIRSTVNFFHWKRPHP